MNMMNLNYHKGKSLKRFRSVLSTKATKQKTCQSWSELFGVFLERNGALLQVDASNAEELKTLITAELSQLVDSMEGAISKAS